MKLLYENLDGTMTSEVTDERHRVNAVDTLERDGRWGSWKGSRGVSLDSLVRNRTIRVLL